MKERILIVASDKFIEVGYSSFNMDDLCRDLGISKKTLYEHFSSKKELFETIAENIFKQINKESKEVLDKMVENDEFHFFEQLKNLFEIVNKHHKKLSPKFMHDIRKYAHSVWSCSHDLEKERRRYFDKIWELGIRDGMIKSDINKNIYYMLYFAILHSVIRPDVLADLSLSSFQALEQIYEILMSGILTDEGIKDFRKKIK